MTVRNNDDLAFHREIYIFKVKGTVSPDLDGLIVPQINRSGLGVGLPVVFF